MDRLALTALGILLAVGCRTVDLGDNFVAPEVSLDEDFFHCRIQPEVILRHSCGSGLAGEGGDCHSARSSLRLSAAAEMATPPRCDGDSLLDPVPPSWQANLDNVRPTVQADPLASPFYRRPVGLDSHPRTIYGEADPAAMLVFDWISAGAL